MKWKSSEKGIARIELHYQRSELLTYTREDIETNGIDKKLIVSMLWQKCNSGAKFSPKMLTLQIENHYKLIPIDRVNVGVLLWSDNIICGCKDNLVQ